MFKVASHDTRLGQKPTTVHSNPDQMDTMLSTRRLSNSGRSSLQTSATFAQSFIRSESRVLDNGTPHVLEGENDFSGKRYVWVQDPVCAFLKGWVVEDLNHSHIVVQFEDGSQRTVENSAVDKVNPGRFDKADDMAELTHLNEPSVVHNLQTRYKEDLIYTYSGLFLVAINPYHALSIYSPKHVALYKGKGREDTKPHIFAVADEAFQKLADESENQSILVTGESGAGKTENTKKVIQYLAAVASSQIDGLGNTAHKERNLSEQILQANPILESFGNAQTIRNHNSSRFGKFIRIEFNQCGRISGAYIDWYLLEKSRVVKAGSGERNYHVFYQLLAGATASMKRDFLLESLEVKDFAYLRDGNQYIPGVSDSQEWSALLEAFRVMGIEEQKQKDILQIVAAILFLGNIRLEKESMRTDQASLGPDVIQHASSACRLLGIDCDDFVTALLHPRVKAGREWVVKSQTPDQARSALDAISKSIYERAFGDLVSRINLQLDHTGSGFDKTNFIGVLDIAGFEIFQDNGFEQLCINYTNEKLQQFFNHHMFVLEQEEYAREKIEWKFIDFGKDLQPTIDLIELPNPIGVFSCLDEESVMPKATDKTFTDKMHSLWDKKTPKYRASRLSSGFVLTHYAAEVEYSTHGWLEKNKDPLSDSITRLLAQSSNAFTASLFSDCGEIDDSSFVRTRGKRGLFRTVAQKHKEQLSSLMAQLHSTQPHFVRCILPNHAKRPKTFDTRLVLDQLRCNGVLEGIRIARTGFPNRLTFSEFRQRYEVLCRGLNTGSLQAQEMIRSMLHILKLESTVYRIGLTKVFFRAGILAELEEARDKLINDIIARFQVMAKGYTQRRSTRKLLYRAEAAIVIRKNFAVYTELWKNPWWNLCAQLKPTVAASQSNADVRRRDEVIERLRTQVQQSGDDRLKIEEEKRRVESELQNYHNTLESERALALDKEEIFKRLQAREFELMEKLNEAIEDQEKVEDQLDNLVEAKQTAESQLGKLRAQLEQAGQIIERLEAERSVINEQAKSLSKRLEEVEQSTTVHGKEHETLIREVKMLQSQLQLQDRKWQEQETKFLASQDDLEASLKARDGDILSAKTLAKSLQDQNNSMRRQLQDVSTASTGYEDLLRQKDGDLAIQKMDLEELGRQKRKLEAERTDSAVRLEKLLANLQEVQSRCVATTSEKSQLEQELSATKKLLNAKLSEDAQANDSRKLLQAQLDKVKQELFVTQANLSREQQTKEETQKVHDQAHASMRDDYQALNEAKIKIEKELYVQQDGLRRAVDGRASAEKYRKQLQDELIKLRQRFAEAERSRIDAEETFERKMRQQANSRTLNLSKELEARNVHIDEILRERSRLAEELFAFKQSVSNSHDQRHRNDQEKERLERELTVFKGRLTASENDNRVLLNKIQQKNLDIARTHSKAGENQRSRMMQLQAEKCKLEEDNKRLHQTTSEAQLVASAKEKQQEKMILDLEDLQHQLDRDRKASRTAEKSTSTAQVKLTEAMRELESEKQLREQAQANTRRIQLVLDEANQEVFNSRQQLAILVKAVAPEVDPTKATWDRISPQVICYSNLADQLTRCKESLRIATEKYAQADERLSEMRNRHAVEVIEVENRQSNSKRQILDELHQNTVTSSRSPRGIRKHSWSKDVSVPTTPDRKPGEVSLPVAKYAPFGTIRSHQPSDSSTEVSILQSQLSLSESKVRQLESQISRLTAVTETRQDESPSVRRMQKLERENGRLNDELDVSSRKLSEFDKSARSNDLTLRDVQTKSHEELFDLISTQETSRRKLVQQYNQAVSDLSSNKSTIEKSRHAKSTLEVELRDIKSELKEFVDIHERDTAEKNQLIKDFGDVQIQLDAEESRSADLESSLNVYKRRADEYFGKLEQAEIAILKSSRAEQQAKSQLKEFEEAHVAILTDREQVERLVEDLQRQNQSYEGKVEDLAADLEGTMQAKRRLQHELEDYRSQRAADVESEETSLEQTRRKYQGEFSNLTNELDIERDNVIHARAETSRLRDELEELRAKWDDEVLNSSAWAKEKARLDITLQDLTASRDEAVNAHNDAQSRVVSLLTQARTLRGSVEAATDERDQLLKDKRALEARLSEAADRLESLARSESPSMRNTAELDKEILGLQAKLAQQEDVAAAAVSKMRKTEAVSTEMQKEMAAERDNNHNLLVEKAALERSVKELQGRVVDLETKGYTNSSSSNDVRFLNNRIQDLEQKLEHQDLKHAESLRSTRNVDRTIKELQGQLERKEKTAKQLSDDISRGRDKVDRLLSTIDELQADEAKAQLAARRAERDLREEKERALRLERELEGWKGLRMERAGSIPPPSVSSLRRGGTSEWGGSLLRSNSRAAGAAMNRDLTADPFNSLNRKMSTTKGFL